MTSVATLGAALLTAAVVVLAIVSVPAGAQDTTLSKSEIKNLIAHAQTKADHERIAQYFDAEAAKYEAEAKEHAELALQYRQSPSPTITKFPGSMQTFQHCGSLSKSLQKAAEDARALAAVHREMAKRAQRYATASCATGAAGQPGERRRQGTISGALPA